MVDKDNMIFCIAYPTFESKRVYEEIWAKDDANIRKKLLEVAHAKSLEVSGLFIQTGTLTLVWELLF